MKKVKYPNSLRIDDLFFQFCDIAMGACYRAYILKEQIKKNKYYEVDCLNDYFALDNEVAITAVFSAMTIESLLNDFAATCIGDEAFYDSFDRLSAIGKLDLISLFILHKRIDKSKSMYCRMKNLFRLRDSLVHNKSKKYSMPKGAGKEFQPDNNEPQITEGDDYLKSEVNNMYKVALDSLKTIKEVVDYLENSCEGYYVASLLFHKSKQPFFDDDAQIEMINYIHKTLRIKAV